MPRPSLALPMVLLLGTLSGLPAAFAENIYQWVDPAGRVIYGDQPPPDRPSRRLELPPAPSPTAAQAARERAEAVQRLADEFAAERRRREAEAAAAEALRRERQPAPSAAENGPEGHFYNRYREPRWHPGWFWPPRHRHPDRYPRWPPFQKDPPPDVWPPDRAPEFTQPRRAPEFTQHLPTPGRARQ
jgi:hypothetical protein